MIQGLLTRGEALLNDSLFFKIIIIIIVHPCMKTLRGMNRGMYCENQITLMHGMLKENQNKGTSWFHDGYVRIIPMKILIKKKFVLIFFFRICRG
jgi:hypothetical protein